MKTELFETVNGAAVLTLPKQQQSTLPVCGQLAYRPKEYKCVALRELPTTFTRGETPEAIRDFWRDVVPTDPRHNPNVECFVVVMLNSRRRIMGYNLVSIGTLNTALVHPREVFQAPIIMSAAAIVLTHNHPSGDPTPSEGDIKATRDLIRAGQLLKIEVLNHVIIGRAETDRPKDYCSLRELGYFYQ